VNLASRTAVFNPSLKPALPALPGLDKSTNAWGICLQCGTCTATCNLTTPGGFSPRRILTLFHFGQVEEALLDTGLWSCLECKDCSISCPVGIGPGRVIAAARRAAMEHFAVPRVLARLLGNVKALAAVVLLPTSLLVLAMLYGGTFSPQASPVSYASMLPHRTIYLLFGPLAVLAVLSASLSVVRAWKGFAGVKLREVDLPRLARALRAALRNALNHKGFSECERFPFARWAHVAVLYGFLALCAVAVVVGILTVSGAPYPLSAFHPLKILGNAAGLALLAGVARFGIQRLRASRNGEASSYFDWTLVATLMLASSTGLLAAVMRHWDCALAAYPTYFIHLVSVFILIAGLPYSKLAHAVYRVVAFTAHEYKTLVQHGHWKERNAA
jgi:quinone-modifying oxidoreductase subunit QmoC